MLQRRPSGDVQKVDGRRIGSQCARLHHQGAARATWLFYFSHIKGGDMATSRIVQAGNTYLSIYLVYICLAVYLSSIYLSLYLSIYLVSNIYLSSIYQSVFVSFYLSISYLSI